VRFNENRSGQEMAPPSESMMSLKIFSAMCAPLILNERIIGIFYVDARQLMNNFTEVDQFLFDYLADHAAIAIFNSKKFNDLQAESQRLKQTLGELEATHAELESRHQKLLTQIGQPLKPVKQISAQAAGAEQSPAAHTYSAGGVVLNALGQVLVVSQRGTSWSLPKGHIEVGEEPAVTAQREIFEESGISYLRLLQSLGSYQRSSLNSQGQADLQEMKTIYMYLFTTQQVALHPQDADNPEARWVEMGQVAELLTHPKDQAFFQQVQPEIEKAFKQSKKFTPKKPAEPHNHVPASG
jgi:8-oxo-dGTP pyrophosphatase MutT (NUDIX family)